jgi:hypothetical protein
MKEIVMNFFLGTAAITLTYFFRKTEGGPSWADIGVGLYIAVLGKIGLVIWEEWRHIGVILQSLFIKPGKPVRVSMAYLIRIKINGKYFLIKNHRDQIGYQPVGGVYRYLENENADFFDRIGLIPDHNMRVDKESLNDLRKELRRRSRLFQFLKWFNSKKNRETDPWREFHEELIVDRLIAKEHFPYIQYTFCKSHITPIKSSVKFPIDEVLYADIYELKWENEAQQKEFEKLFGIDDERYVFATPQEIAAGSKNGKTILPHSKKIL